VPDFNTEPSQQLIVTVLEYTRV